MGVSVGISINVGSGVLKRRQLDDAPVTLATFEPITIILGFRKSWD
jgi:hypothetical protein